MDIVVTGRHLTVSDRFRAHIEEKLEKITQLEPRTRRVEVLVSHEPNRRQAEVCDKVEITCHAKGPVVRAEACVEDKYAALDVAIDKLMERLRRQKDRRQVHRGRRTPESVARATARIVPPAEGGPVGTTRRGRRRSATPRSRSARRSTARPDDARGRAQRDGARRPRLLPLPRHRHRSAERRLPPARLELRCAAPRTAADVEDSVSARHCRGRSLRAGFRGPPLGSDLGTWNDAPVLDVNVLPGAMADAVRRSACSSPTTTTSTVAAAGAPRARRSRRGGRRGRATASKPSRRPRMLPDVVLMDVRMPRQWGASRPAAGSGSGCRRPASSCSPCPTTRPTCSRRSGPAPTATSSRTSPATRWPPASGRVNHGQSR